MSYVLRTGLYETLGYVKKFIFGSVCISIPKFKLHFDGENGQSN